MQASGLDTSYEKIPRSIAKDAKESDVNDFETETLSYEDRLHNVEHIESEEIESQVVQIMQLIGMREDTVVLPGFTG